MRTQGGVAFWRNLEFLQFLEFKAEIWDPGFVIGWHDMPSFSSKNFRMIEYELKEK